MPVRLSTLQILTSGGFDFRPLLRRDQPGGSLLLHLLTVVLVALGLGLRCWHYFRNPSVWHDEAALIVNVLGKDFGELLGPLFFAEAAPPLFLWVEKEVSLLLDDSSFAFRLVPFAASCLAVILLVPIAQHILRPAAVPWALFLFATSETLAWHACEAKPYAVDVLAAVIVLIVFTHIRSLIAQLLIFAALAPPIIVLCYPGCFLFGGVLVALLPAVTRDRRALIWLTYGLLTVAVFLPFALLVLGPVAAQRCDMMAADWRRFFPPWDHPWAMPGWLILSTAEVCRYACKPLGQFLIVIAALGAAHSWRNGQRRFVSLLLVPIALALVASLMGAYPYGGARVMAYAAPAVILLIAAGTPQALIWLRTRSKLGTAVLLVLLLSPFSVAVQRLAIPWERADSAAVSEYVLSRRLPDEIVIANDWEFLYYYRRIGPSLQMAWGDPLAPGCCLIANESETRFRLRQDMPSKPGDRVWVVAKGLTPENRQAYIDGLPWNEWRVVERREFTRITVVLVERRRIAPDVNLALAPSAGRSAPPRSRL
jgi:hypothetical protein